VLLDHACDLSYRDSYGCTTLDWALVKEEERLIELLQRSGGRSTPNYAQKLQGVWGRRYWTEEKLRMEDKFTGGPLMAAAAARAERERLLLQREFPVEFL
jgi:hypothetical protein